MKVKDAMTASVKVVRPDVSLKDVAAILAEHRIGGMPVVDDGGDVLGVVGKGDILLKERGEAPHGLRGLLHHREATALASKVEARTAQEAMTAPAITIEPERQLSSAAELMLEHGVNRLPVVEKEQLVGIVTRSDLVRAFARSDEEITREIRDDVFRGLSWPDRLQLAVRKGEVTLRGEVDSRYDADALPREVRNVPGVMSVDAELMGWDVDADEKVVVTTRL